MNRREVNGPADDLPAGLDAPVFDEPGQAQAFAMTIAPSDRQAPAAGDRYQALLAVAAAILAHRDLGALFHDLAGRLQQVVRFDYLTLVLHEERTAGDIAARSIHCRLTGAPLSQRQAISVETGWPTR